MTSGAKPGKPKAGFPPFPPLLGIALRFPHFHRFDDRYLYIKEDPKTASLKNQQLRVGQNKLPKWARFTCQTEVVLRAQLRQQQELEQIDKTNGQVRRDLWIANYQLGRALLASQRVDEALTYLDFNLKRELEAAKTLPDDPHTSDDLVDARVAVAQALRKRSDLTGALAQLQEALKVTENLVQRFPANIDYRSKLALLWTEMATTFDLTAKRMLAQAAAYRHAARDARIQSRDIYMAMRREGVLSGKDRKSLDRVLREVQ